MQRKSAAVGSKDVFLGLMVAAQIQAPEEPMVSNPPRACLPAATCNIRPLDYLNEMAGLLD